MNPIKEYKDCRFFLEEIKDLEKRIEKETNFKRKMHFREVKQKFQWRVKNNKFSTLAKTRAYFGA